MNNTKHLLFFYVVLTSIVETKVRLGEVREHYVLYDYVHCVL